MCDRSAVCVVGVGPSCASDGPVVGSLTGPVVEVVAGPAACICGDERTAMVPGRGRWPSKVAGLGDEARPAIGVDGGRPIAGLGRDACTCAGIAAGGRGADWVGESAGPATALGAGGRAGDGAGARGRRACVGARAGGTVGAGAGTDVANVAAPGSGTPTSGPPLATVSGPGVVFRTASAVAAATLFCG